MVCLKGSANIKLKTYNNNPIEKAIKSVSNIYLNNATADDDQCLYVEYNTEDGEKHKVSSPINYIVEHQIYTVDLGNGLAEKRLCVLYSDPAFRASLTNPVMLMSEKFGVELPFQDLGNIRGPAGEYTNVIIEEETETLKIF